MDPLGGSGNITVYSIALLSIVDFMIISNTVDNSKSRLGGSSRRPPVKQVVRKCFVSVTVEIKAALPHIED
jgi:hypothetical protein